MAVNPIYGPIVNKAVSDPNGPPGTTSGNVPVTDATDKRVYKEPTAGAMASLPPYNQSPHLDPLAETFAPPTTVGPGT